MPTQQSSGGRNGRWLAGSEQQRVSPDAVRQAARDRVAKLQQALEVLGDISGAEVDGLRSALEKAKKMSPEPTVEVQITESKGFIARAEKRVADLDAQRAPEVAALEEGRAKLLRLGSEVSCPPHVVLPSPEDAVSEVMRLRDLVSQLQAQIGQRPVQDAPLYRETDVSVRTGAWPGPCRAERVAGRALSHSETIAVSSNSLRSCPKERSTW